MSWLGYTEIFHEGERIEMKNILHRMGFVQWKMHKFVRSFTCIYVENGQLFIGHSVNDKRTPIEYADLKEWIQYFDRI